MDGGRGLQSSGDGAVSRAGRRLPAVARFVSLEAHATARQHTSALFQSVSELNLGYVLRVSLDPSSREKGPPWVPAANRPTAIANGPPFLVFTSFSSDVLQYTIDIQTAQLISAPPSLHAPLLSFEIYACLSVYLAQSSDGCFLVSSSRLHDPADSSIRTSSMRGQITLVDSMWFSMTPNVSHRAMEQTSTNCFITRVLEEIENYEATCQQDPRMRARG